MMQDLPSFKKTRIAPTPSGYLHLGNILSFAITAALARATGARILLRIDDLDQERAEKEFVRDIFQTLHFLDLPWDEGPRNSEEFEKEYSQLHRMENYRQALEQLKKNTDIYACTCSRKMILVDNPNGIYPGTCREKNIPLDTENAGWRLHTTNENDLKIKTLDGRFIQTRLPKTMQDFLVRKKDHSPAYQLTSLLDDLYYDIDLVVRGEDLWDSTLAQHELAGILRPTGDKFRDSTFYHHPLLLDAQKRKLSKTAGDMSIQYLRHQGEKPAAIYSRIAAMMGYPARIANWQQLADLVLSKEPGPQ